jgi:DNA-binding response OmpR family regulator
MEGVMENSCYTRATEREENLRPALAGQPRVFRIIKTVHCRQRILAKPGSENVTQHRILVIEDQDDLAALYAKTLERAGYSVTNAFSGEEGIAEFDDSGADCILLDMTLPEMNGTSVLAELRRTDAQIPVIVITGETSTETRRECERLGVTAYLAKPPVYEEVLAAVAHALAAQDSDEDYEVVTLAPSRAHD